jgi:hypothetical protein
MAAFTRFGKELTRTRRLQDVRNLLAATLLPRRSCHSDCAPPIAGWKVWLFTGWLVIVAIWGVVRVVGILS